MIASALVLSSLGAAAGAAGEGDAALGAAAVNSQNLEFNSRQVKEQRLEDEARFRSTMRREQAQNVIGVAASGIRLEGSPLDVLRENARNVEKDAANIRLGSLGEQQAFKRQARNERRRGKEASRAASIGAASSVLKGLSDVGKL